MLIRFIVSLAIMLAPYKQRDPLEGLHRATPKNAERCESHTDPQEYEADKVCRSLDARDRVEFVYELIEQYADSEAQALELRRICARESWCGRYGFVDVHKRDSGAAEPMYYKAVKRGWLRPNECEEHGQPADGDFSPWGTRSLFAIAGAYSMRYFDDCQSPDILEDLEQSVIVGRRHLMRLDSIGADTCWEHVKYWVGPGKWNKWSWAKKTVRARRQCGVEDTTQMIRAALADSVDERLRIPLDLGLRLP